MTPSFDAADAFGALTTTESLTDAQIEERSQALLDQLTLEEKIGLTYGEDSHHLGAFGAALTCGVQGHVMACAKHYALNSMENARFTVDVSIDPRALHEVYLPHFKRAVDAGVASMMSAYNSVNGEWCGQNKTLLHDILKEQWGFQGFVLTDFVWGMRDARKAAFAGQDLEMPFQNLFHRHLKGLVERGEVPLARIDDAALRLLRQQWRFAQGRNPSDYPSDVVGCEANRQLAREAAQKSIVLLKNEGNLLPLTNVQRVAVIGKLADTPNTGDAGSSTTKPAYVITPLQGLRNALGDGATVVYDDGSDPARAAAAAAATDVAICVVGYTSADEGEYVAPDTMAQLATLFPPPSAEEAPIAQALMQAPPSSEEVGFGVGGDRSSLTLHADDEALIQAVAAAHAHTIVAIMAGSGVIPQAWRGAGTGPPDARGPRRGGGEARAPVLRGGGDPKRAGGPHLPPAGQ